MSEDLQDLELEEDTQKGKFLTFFLEKEVYGLEISLVTEIIGIQPITELPEVPEYVKGIINLRGKIIPVTDMRRRFSKPEVAYTDRTCIIVIEMRDILLGMIVDGVADVLAIPEENIVPPPDLKTSENKYIKGIGKVDQEVKLLLDCDKIFNEDMNENTMNLQMEV